MDTMRRDELKLIIGYLLDNPSDFRIVTNMRDELSVNGDVNRTFENIVFNRTSGYKIGSIIAELEGRHGLNELASIRWERDSTGDETSLQCEVPISLQLQSWEFRKHVRKKT